MSVYNRTRTRTEDLLAEQPDKKKLVGTYSLEEFVQSLEVPRKILIMVQAGAGIDETIEQLMPLLDKGDILIDGGNSLLPRHERRRGVTEQGAPLLRHGRFRRRRGRAQGPVA